MSDDSLEEIYEKSKVTITPEKRESIRKQAQKRKNWLKDNYVSERVIAKILKARIDDINIVWNVINKYQKENPFKSVYYEGEVKIVKSEQLSDGIYCFTLDVPYYGGFGILGRILVQLINAVQANIEVKTMADLIPFMDQEAAINLYYDAREYLTEVARYLKRLYSNEDTKIIENHDPDFRAGRPKYLGYDVAFKKMNEEGLTDKEGFEDWKRNYPNEYKSSKSPLLAFQVAMKRRRKSTKR